MLKYYIKEYGNGPEDAQELPSGVWNCDTDCAEDFAEAAAAYDHDHHDGWECTWPIVYTVVYDDGTEVDLEVEREFDPIFSACEVHRAKD